MTDFVHCNQCYIRPPESTRFLIGNCFHVVCVGCNQNVSAENRCPICSKQATFVEINRDMNKRLQTLFKDPQVYITEKMGALKRKYEFQRDCYANLVKHIVRMKTKFGQLARACYEQKTKLQQGKQEIEDLKRQLEESEQKERSLEEEIAALTKELQEAEGESDDDGHLFSDDGEHNNIGFELDSDALGVAKSLSGETPKNMSDYFFGLENGSEKYLASDKRSMMSVTTDPIPFEKSRNISSREASFMDTPVMLGMKKRSAAVPISSMMPPPPGNPYMDAVLHRSANRSGGHGVEQQSSSSTAKAVERLITMNETSKVLTRTPGIHQITPGNIIPPANTPKRSFNTSANRSFHVDQIDQLFP